MKLRTLAAIGIGAAGVAAAGNRVLARRAGPVEPALDGEQHTYRWRGMDVAYTELGDPDRRDVVLIHGIGAAASSREFAGVVDDLVAEFHVIAPDLPGFGRSDRPALVYSAGFYESFVTDFLRDVADDPVCVAPSLSAAYVTSAATQVDVSGLVLVCPRTTAMGERRPTVRTLLRTPLVGPALYNLVTSKPAIRYVGSALGYPDDREVDAEEIDYRWWTAHQPGARFAPASFLAGSLDVDVDLGSTLASIEAPVTLVWGREATTPPLADGRTLAEEANAKLVVIDRSKQLPHVEQPDAFVRAIREDFPLVEHE